jgi:hypothetical protein
MLVLTFRCRSQFSLGEIMRSKTKAALSVFTIGALLAVGGASAYAAMDRPAAAPAPAVAPAAAPSAATAPALATPGIGSKDPSHPECYDAAKLNDPSDFCYQTMGPWNSTLATDDEVRRFVSVDAMARAGMSAAQIQRYYPAYSPATK